MSPAANARFALHTETVPASELAVLEWSCRERICAPFRLELAARCSLLGAEEMAARLLGQRAVFSFDGPSGVQARRGVIVEARVEGGLDRANGRVRVVVVPRLGLLAHAVQSRIFQELSTPEILKAVFGEWQLDHVFKLARSHPKRPYVTQYRETDLAFVTRLCAKEGLSFFLEQRPFEAAESTEPGEDKLVLCDDATFQQPIAAPPSGGTGSILSHAAERFGEREEEISGFSLGHTVSPELVRLGDFDFRRPGLTLSAVASLSKAERSPIGDSLGGDRMGVTLHAQRADKESEGNAHEIDDELARIRLEQVRRSADVGRGRSRCGRLMPGTVFTLDGHPVGSLNRDYAVTSVEHHGRTPEEGERAAGPDEVYGNELECVFSSVLSRAPLEPAAIQQALETATVVGPKGEEIHCDDHGRVKVQFHWDLKGKRNERSSCWLRVAQPWAGANWGAQFIPRIGSEVLVGFLGGDVDQPIVMGSLYNGARPYPFLFPEEVTQSGFRSQSTPGGDGFNELVLDDRKGRERLSLRASRDLQLHAQNDHTLEVKNAERVRIGGSSERTVAGDAKVTVLGEATESVAKSYQLTVQGSHALSVNGDAELRVSGNHTTRLEGTDRAEHFAEALTTFKADQVVRVLGHQITVVGQDDARRSSTLHVEGSISQSSTGTTELSSEKEIVLRVGESLLRLSAEGIELVTKKLMIYAEQGQAETKEQLTIFGGKQIALNAESIDSVATKTIRAKGKKGQLQLDDNARLDGTMVKLNCAPDPVDEATAEPYEPPKPTKIVLADEEGNPLPGRRYVIVFGDGSERSGMLDENGEAELYLEEGGEIMFPDTDNPRLA